jgi:hypothetical protein
MNSAFENPEWLNYHHLRHFWIQAGFGAVEHSAAN